MSFDFSFHAGNAYFGMELLVAELIFLYSVPKRKPFFLRLTFAVALVLGIAPFLPWVTVGGLEIFPYVMRSILVFTLTVLSLALAFDLKSRVLLALCVAGYALEHIAYRTSGLLARTNLFPELSLGGVSRERLIEIGVMILVYLAMFLTFGRWAAKNECFQSSDPRLDMVSLLVVFICVIMTRFPRVFGETVDSFTGSFYSILCCFLALFIQFNVHQMEAMKNEQRMMERIRQEEKKSYEISKAAMESVNIKIHDMKHKIFDYQGRLPQEEMDSLKRDINLYDSSIHIGNEVLDVLLTEKSLQCHKKQIRFSCSGDGKCLDFMRPMDIYSLFGNAVDNAIEAVQPLGEAKKVIDMSISQRGDYVFLSVTNYFEGSISWEDGLPQTTKKEDPGYHGFGMKSMQLIAQRYEGGLSAETRGELFHLNIYLKRPRG